MSIKVIVSVLVTDNDKILMVQEGKDYKNGLWNLPTGVLKLGEKITDAAVRKAIGEAGYDVKITGFLKMYNYFIDIEKEWHVVRIVLTGEAAGEAVMNDSGEVIGTKWMTFDKVDEMFRQGKVWSLNMIQDAVNVFRQRGAYSLDEILSDDLFLE